MSNITWIVPEPPKDWGYFNPNKRSLLFKVTLKDISAPNGYMYYGAKRTLQSKKERIEDGYVGSLGKNAKTFKTIELANKFKHLFATSEEVIVEVLEYGNKEDIGYGEIKMLKEVDNGRGAALSEEWFNSTNGGGQNARGFGTLDGMIKTYSKAKSTLKTIEGIIDKLGLKERKSGLQNIKATLQNIQNEMNKTNKDLFPINFFNKNTLTNLIDLSNEKHNCRVKPFIVEFWTVYRDDFDIDPNPAKWEFIVVLLDENGNPLSCASGSNRSKGNIESKKGIGLFGIEIEYDVWKDWPPHIHIRFGSKFNPNEKKRRAAQSIPEAVKDVVAFCKGEKLFKEVIDPDTKKKEKILDIHHKVNRDYLKNEQGFKSNEIDKILDLAESQAEEDILVDDNIIIWSNKELANDSQLKEGYDNKIKLLEIEYDWTHKYSVSAAPPEEKIAEVIMKSGYKKKGLLLPYAKSTERRKKWHNAELPDSDFDKYPNGNPKYTDEKRVRTHISGANSELFSNYNIDVMFMPVRKSQAIAEGWIPKTWKKPKKKKSEGRD